jgi:Flp pilus assembly protein TadD
MQRLAEPSADEQFGAAFRAWGLDVDATPPAVAATRMRERPAAVVAEVLVALDEWASERRRRGKKGADWRRPSELAAALDDEPTSRRRELRQLLAGGSLGRERALGLLAVGLRPVPVPFDAVAGPGRMRLRQVAAEVDVATEPALGLLMLERALLEAGDPGLAERLLRGAVHARPQEVVLHHALGQLSERREDWTGAVECYATERALRPDVGEPLADALVHAGRVEEGLSLYGRLVAKQPDNPWLHFRLAYTLDDLHRYPEAEAALRQALRLQPDDPDAHYNLGFTLSNQGRYKEAEAAFREAIRLRPDDPRAHCRLGTALSDQSRHEEAEAAFRQAIRLKPDDPFVHSRLGTALSDQGRHEEAEAAYRQALRLKPDDPDAHFRLGLFLDDRGRYPEAEAEYRQAIRFRPDYPLAHYNLGDALSSQRRYKEAEAAFREAIRLKPDDPETYINLGVTLIDQGRYKEAEAEYRQALRLKPDDPETHNNLGKTLSSQGRYQEAEAAFREAIRWRPNYPLAHCNLGDALSSQRRYKEAEAAFREAIRLKPDDPKMHNNLGGALIEQGRHKEAEAACREAIRLKPDHPLAHLNLGVALDRQGRYQEAEAEHRQAIRFRPDYPLAHTNLGSALRAQGRFVEALRAYRHGHELGSKTPGWSYPSADWVRRCERLVELDRKLPAVLAGQVKPASAAEALDLGRLCKTEKYRRFATAARLFADAFAADPRLLDDMGHRYNAACYAALAGCGKGSDADKLDAKERARLRRQSRDWLRAHREAWAKRLSDGKPKTREDVLRAMRHWQQDTDLAGVRDEPALAALPAEERDAWQKLWADVATLTRQAEGKK